MNSSTDDNGGKDKDYVVVIEATEVGDPTGGISFKIINSDVENLSVEISIGDQQVSGSHGNRTYSFASVEKNNKIVICEAFSYTGPNPEAVAISINFSTDQNNTFGLAPDQGINQDFTVSSENTFVDTDVPVQTPAYEALAAKELVFIQCLEENAGNQAFLCGDTQTGQVSMQEVYTSQTPGMTWILGQTEDNQFYLELEGPQGGFLLSGNSEGGTIQLRKDTEVNTKIPGLNWRFLPGDASNTEVNYYQMECSGEGSKVYLQGDTSTGALSLQSNLQDNRNMKWYIHRINN